MSVARSSMPPGPASTWTPESAWIAQRVEAARVTVCSWVKSASRAVVSFIGSTPLAIFIEKARRSRGCG